MEKVLLMLLCLSMMMASCSTTRVVTVEPSIGGEIMVHQGIFGDARSDANKLMKSNCGAKGYAVVKEGEAVIGTTTSGSTSKRTDKKMYFQEQESSSSQTRNQTEWRLQYTCKKAKSKATN